MNIGRENFHRVLVGKKIEVLSAFANAIEARDEYTKWHSARVADFSGKIARKMDLSDKDSQLLRWAATVHDVGKIGIPEPILGKTTPLSAAELRVIRQHPAIGAEILKPIRSFKTLIPIIYHHHEHFDGNGYPDGLQRDEIPLLSRIITVADAFEAMMSNRCYRKGLGLRQAVAELQANAGTQFDPRVIDAFMHLVADGKFSNSEPVIDYVI